MNIKRKQKTKNKMPDLETISTLNVNSLNTPIKAWRLAEWIKKYNTYAISKKTQGRAA